MKITKKFLDIKNACDEGKKWFCENTPFKSDIDCIKKIMKNRIIIHDVDERYNWSNWVICRILNKNQKIKYAIYAAEQVINILAKEALKNNTALAYADAAASYASLAYADAAASYASLAYADAAASYASYAAAYAAEEKLQIKIINFGLKLLK